MNTKKKKPLRFRIYQIETIQFALLQDKMSRDDLSFSVRFGYQLDYQNKLIRTIFKFDLLHNDHPAVVIEVAVDFNIESESFESQIEKELEYRVPKDFAIHLAMVTVGTTRGILHEKTRNTPFNTFPIPTIDLTQSIKNDLIFTR